VGAGGHPFRRLGGGKAGAHREATADTLGERHHVRLDAGPFIGEQLAGAADAGLNLVEDEDEAVLITERAEAAEELAAIWPVPPNCPCRPTAVAWDVGRSFFCTESREGRENRPQLRCGNASRTRTASNFRRGQSQSSISVEGEGVGEVRAVPGGGKTDG
jgi:hypothetical protein